MSEKRPEGGERTAETLGDKPGLAGQAPAFAPGKLLGDHYEIVESIGRGGMGVIYLAKNLALQKMVAIKVLRRELAENETSVKRFHREARAAAAIAHPNIVNVTDLGTTAEGEPFIVMEHLEGRDLRSVLRTDGALYYRRCVHITRQVLKALSAAHGRGIIHRDLKAENVFLCARDEGEDVKLLDFGISKLLAPNDQAYQSTLTATGSMMGTPRYFAPEQAKSGSTVDQRVDLYSLGVLMYEMLTGEPPFRGATPVELLLKHASEIPKPPHQLRPDLDIPRALERIVLRALKKDPADRFASADEMLAALDGLDTAPTAEQGPPRVAVRSRRWGAALVALLLLAGLVGFFSVSRDGREKPAGVTKTSADGAVEAVAPDASSKPDKGSPQAYKDGAAADSAPAADRGRAPQRPAQLDAAKTIWLRVRATPASASISIAGQPVGRGSVRRALSRGKGAVSVRVVAPGYRPWTKMVVPDRNRGFKVTLKKAGESAGDLEGNPYR